MANSKNKKTSSHLPTLAKIWWASMPFVFASQGLWCAPAEKSQVPNYSSFLWPVEDQEDATVKKLLHQNWDEAGPAVTPGAHDLRAAKAPKQTTSGKQMDLDWLEGQLPTSTRFQVPEEVARACKSTQDCRFDSCEDSSYAPRQAYLRHCQHAAHARAAASSISTGNDCQEHHPTWCSGPSCDSLSWTNTTCVSPQGTAELAQIPSPACEGCSDSWYGQSADPRSAKNLAWNESSVAEAPQDVVLSSVPPAVCAANSPLCERLSTAGDKPLAYLTIVTLNDSTILCPDCTPAESHVPALVTAPEHISLGDPAHGRGTALRSQLASRKPQLRSSVGTYTASAPSSPHFLDSGDSCIGAECGPNNAIFTSDFPTVARIAFDGTSHDSIDDFAHVVNFAYTEFVPTDPCALCEIDRISAPTEALAAIEAPHNASRIFSQIASDRYISSSLSSEQIARSGPDPRLVHGWATTSEAKLNGFQPSVTASTSSVDEQILPTYWSALDSLVAESQPDHLIAAADTPLPSETPKSHQDLSISNDVASSHNVASRIIIPQQATEPTYNTLVGVQAPVPKTHKASQQLHISAAPEGARPAARKVPVTFERLPGLGSQEVAAKGQKVPTGLNIASGRTGVPHTAPKDDLVNQIRSLHGGYFYYVGEGTNPNLSTSQDHLQVSGGLKRIPGVASDSPHDALNANLDEQQRVGVRESSERVNSAVIALAPGISDARGQRKTNPIEKQVTLTATPKDNLTQTLERADLCTGKARCKVVKVVNAQTTQQRLSQAGKSAARVQQIASNEKTDHRFSVDIVPRTDSAPTLKNIVGHPPKSSSSVQTRPRPASGFVDVAQANDSIGYEPSAFLSVGAHTHYDDALFHESDESYSVGAVNHRYSPEVEEWDAYTESYNTLPDPGIEPAYSKTLGVRREGIISSLTPSEIDDEPVNHPIAWEEAVVTEHYEDQQPPDKWTSSPADRAYSVASQEETERDVEETQVSSQKKNRTLETAASVPHDSPDSVSPNRAPEVAAAEASESVYKVPQQLDPSEDPSITGWQNEWSQPKVAPLPSTGSRDLKPRDAVDQTIAQETLFDSGVPAADNKRPNATEKQPVKINPTPPVGEEDVEDESEGLLINFRDVAITEYIRFVSQQTDKNFIFNEDDLQFNITIISEKPTTIDNIMAALLQELRIHGLRVIEQGNNIIIHKDDKVRGPTRVVKADQSDSGETQIVTRVFQLSSIPAEKMKEVILPILSSQALVQVLPETNNLLITDFGINVNKIADLIHSLDKPTVAFEVGQYVGRNNFIENLIPLAEEIIQPFAEKQSIVFVPHLATNSVFIVANPTLLKRALGIFEHLDALEGATKILTLEDLAKGGADALKPKEPGQKQKEEDEARKRRSDDEQDEERRSREEQDRLARQRKAQPEDLLGTGRRREREEAPQEPPPQEPQYARTKFYIHKLQYRQGDQLQDALLRISDSLRQSENVSVELINAINSIQWIESSNALIVTGTGEALGRVKELIEEIDVPLRQVFLEMLILDTNISDSLTYAVEITSNFKSESVAGVQGFSGSPAQVGSGTGLTSPTAIIGAVNAAAATAADAVISAASLAGVSTPGFNLGIIGRRILKDGTFFNTMGALVQAVHDDINTEIVLNPKIIVEDNNEAEIFVGENIAFQTQNVVNNEGTVVSRNYEFRDVGTTLKVRPQIGNNNIITLEIEQEVSSTVTTQTDTGAGGGGTASANLSPGPSTSTSRTITKVHVPNEFFVVISGMIRDEKKKHRNQIPCLGGIPIIGGLGSREDTTLAKRNLMIFIRPQIIETEWDFDNLTKTQQNIYKDKCRRPPRWKYEADEGLEFLNLPRINERCEDDTYLPGYDDESAPVCDY